MTFAAILAALQLVIDNIPAIANTVSQAVTLTKAAIDDFGPLLSNPNNVTQAEVDAIIQKINDRHAEIQAIP